MHLSATDQFEIGVFTVLSGIASSLAASRWDVLASLPICYSTAYSLSRLFKAFSAPIRSNVTFQFHRVAGALSIAYGPVLWYKLIVADAQSLHGTLKSIDEVIRPFVWTLAIMNTISGIMLLPSISLQAPLIFRQAFPSSIFLLICTYLLEGSIYARAWFHVTPTLLTNVLLWSFGGAGIVLSLIATGMGVRAGQLLVRMEDGTLSSEEKDGDKSAKGNRNASVSSFLWDVFVDPQWIDSKSWRNQVGLEFLPPKWVSFFSLCVTLAVPGMIMTLATSNVTFAKAIPGIGPGQLRNDQVLTYTWPCLEMLSLAVFPAILFDLTLIMRKRLDPDRANNELLVAMFTGLFGPILLCFSVLSTEDRLSFLAMMRQICWPIFGPLSLD